MDITLKQYANVIADFGTYTKTNGTQATTRTGHRNLPDSLIKAWPDTSTMATTATGTYTGHPLTVSFQGITNGTPEYHAWLDQLTILERFNGRTFRQVPSRINVLMMSRAGEGDASHRHNLARHPELLGLLNMSEPAYRLVA